MLNLVWQWIWQHQRSSQQNFVLLACAHNALWHCMGPWKKVCWKIKNFEQLNLWKLTYLQMTSYSSYTSSNNMSSSAIVRTAREVNQIHDEKGCKYELNMAKYSYFLSSNCNKCIDTAGCFNYQTRTKLSIQWYMEDFKTLNWAFPLLWQIDTVLANEGCVQSVKFVLKLHWSRNQFRNACDDEMSANITGLLLFFLYLAGGQGSDTLRGGGMSHSQHVVQEYILSPLGSLHFIFSQTSDKISLQTAIFFYLRKMFGPIVKPEADKQTGYKMYNTTPPSFYNTRASIIQVFQYRFAHTEPPSGKCTKS